MNKQDVKDRAIPAAVVRQTAEEHIEIDQLTREFIARGGKIEKVGTIIHTLEELKRGWTSR